MDEKGRIEYGETPAPFVTIDKKIAAEELSFLHLPDSIAKVELMVMEGSGKSENHLHLSPRPVRRTQTKKSNQGTPRSDFTL